MHGGASHPTRVYLRRLALWGEMVSFLQGAKFMSIEYILLLLNLVQLGKVTSITVTKSTVTVRIKNSRPV